MLDEIKCIFPCTVKRSSQEFEEVNFKLETSDVKIRTLHLNTF